MVADIKKAALECAAFFMPWLLPVSEELAACCFDFTLELHELVAELLYADGVDYLKWFEDALELFKLGMIGDKGLDTFMDKNEAV